MKPTVGLTYDLRTDYRALGFSEEAVAEFDSEETILALGTALQSLGYAVERIGHIRALCGRLVQGARWDLVFNIAEGVRGRGRESEVPCLLEAFDIVHTFSDPLVCAVTLDKAVAKRLVHSSGLHTPRFHVVRTPADLDHLRLDYPLFAKPIAEGTGKGIDEASRVATPDELAAVCRRLLDTFDQPVLVEEFLPGREFTVGILGTGHDARVLGTLEVQILEKARSTVYSFTVKEQCEQLVRYSRPVPSPLTRAVEALALDAYRVLEVRDAGRADIRMDRDGQPAFMEINPLPGLHPTHSDLPMIATQAGMSYAELIGAIVSSAWARKGRP